MPTPQDFEVDALINDDPIHVATPMGPPTPPRLQIPSPFAPMPVQTLSIAQAAKLDPVAAPRVEDLLKARTPPKPFVAQPLPPVPGQATSDAELAAAPPKKKRRGGTVILLMLIVFLLAGGGFAIWKLILKH